jgi:cell division protein FtsB
MHQMEYLKKRQKSRKRLYSKVTLGVLVLILIIMVHPTWKIFQKSRESKINLERAEAELVDLESRKERLAADVSYLNTDVGRDQEIRNKFGVAREGETMIVIVRDERERTDGEAVSEPGFFSRTWSGVLGIFGLD